MSDRARSTTGRVPPHNLQAEESALGACLLSRQAITAVLDAGLTPDHFYRPTHGHVFDAVLRLHGAGEPADPVTVANELRRNGLLDAIGGPAVLVSLQAATPATTNAGKYASILVEHKTLRDLIEAAGDIADVAYSCPGDVGSALEDARIRLRGVGATFGPGANALNRVDLFDLMENGVPDPEMLLPWLYADRLTVLASEPGLGKSWLATWLAWRVMEAGHSVVYLDEEGGPELVTERLLAVGAEPEVVRERLWYFAFEGRAWTPADLGALQTVLDASGARLAVFDSLADFLVAAGFDENDNAQVTRFVHTVLGRCRDAGCAQLVLDHLPKPQDEGSKRKRRSRYSRGAGSKLAKADVTLLLEAIRPFDAHTSGQLRLFKTKDRRGRLSVPDVRDGLGSLIDVDVAKGGKVVRFTELGAAQRIADGPTRCMADVLSMLRSLGGAELSQAKCIDGMRSAGFRYSNETFVEALERLVMGGKCSRRRVGPALLYSAPSGPQSAEEPLPAADPTPPPTPPPSAPPRPADDDEEPI